MHHPRLRRGVIDAHEGLAAAVDEAGHEAREVVPREAEVDARGVHRPGVDVGEVVGGRELHRVEDARVALGADRGRRPPVEAVAHVAAVVERRRLLEERPAGAQGELDPPLHPVRAIDRPHPDRRAPVLVAHRPEVHRRHGRPVVGDREVELHPERHPRPAVRHVGELDRRVGVEHLGAGRLVDTAVDPPPEVGEDDELQVLVLELERAPGPARAPVGQVRAGGVGVDEERPPREQVESRVHVRQVFLVGRQCHRRFGDPHVPPMARRSDGPGRRRPRRESQQGKPHEGRSHPSHATLLPLPHAPHHSSAAAR